MDALVDLIYIGFEIRKRPPSINKCIAGNPIRTQGRTGSIIRIQPTVEDNKYVYKNVDGVYAHHLVETSPELFALKNAPIKDKASVDLENRAITREDIKAQQEKKAAEEAEAKKKELAELKANAEKEKKEAEKAEKKAAKERKEAEEAEKKLKEAAAPADITPIDR